MKNICKYEIRSRDILSGCIKEGNIFFFGNDIGERIKLESPQTCAEHSVSVDGGLFWTYDFTNNYCYVKSSDSATSLRTRFGVEGKQKRQQISGRDDDIPTKGGGAGRQSCLAVRFPEVRNRKGRQCTSAYLIFVISLTQVPVTRLQ